MNIHKSFLSRRGFTAAFVTAVVPLLLLSSLGCAFMLGRHRNVCVSASSAPRSGVYPQMWYSAAIGYEGLLRNLIVPIFPTFESSWITQVHCYNTRAQSLKITQKCHISSASTINVVFLTENHFDTSWHGTALNRAVQSGVVSRQHPFKTKPIWKDAKNHPWDTNIYDENVAVAMFLLIELNLAERRAPLFLWL